MAKPQTYIEERNILYLTKLRNEIIPYLPKICINFFIGISTTTTVLTRYNYGIDLRIFFDYLVSKNSVLEGKNVNNITYDDINLITSMDIERFIDYVSCYNSPIKGELVRDSDAAKSRKLSTVRCFFKYLYNHDLIKENVASKVITPKKRKKEIIRLENNEVNDMLNVLNSSNSFNSENMNSYNENNTKIRDNAIITLLLSTGIRVSECVGLNINDIDFDNKSFKIIRKGDKEAILFLNDDVIIVLQDYIIFRNEYLNNKGIDPESIDALFISTQNKRISVRAVEIIVKKYAQIVTPLKHITPHKLRSTYGTELYRNTGDIYVVAEVLGHSDINTTKRHYAAISEDIKKSASEKVNFLKNSPKNTDDDN
ncbi:MAG: tyrosine-type recombinase/integrase [Clostridia bacterium]|nr:tyrosine-type recombinase/integrase [Clostridia bacterium]